MADVLYTTTDSIRAAIGVSDVEIGDNRIIDLCVEDQLLIYFDEVVPTHENIQSEGTSPGATAEQKLRWRALRMLTMYAAAVIVLQAAQTLLAQKLDDGGTSMARFAKDDITTLVSNLAGQRDQYLSIVNGESDVTANALPTPFLAVQPGYDPVTGCG